MPDASTTQRLIGLVELTSLEHNCGPAEIKALCARAAGPPPAAAVCVWPQFVGECRRALSDTGVRVATVIGAGGDDVERAIEDAGEALGDGAEEIDLAFPHAAFLRGEATLAAELVREVKGVLPQGARLKVLLESAAFPDLVALAAAGRLALEAGADMLAASTGQPSTMPAPGAGDALLLAIRDSGRPAGFKETADLAGAAEAAARVATIDRLMGAGWVTPSSFRLASRGLHAALAATRSRQGA